MKAKTVTFILLVLLLALFATPVYAGSIPSLPHAFYGAVKINGSLAPVGTQVEVKGEGVQIGVNNNPFVTTTEGMYGGSNPLAPKLIVQGSVTEGATLTFYVNGVKADQTTAWHSGEVTELNLTATIEAPPPQLTPAPAPATPPTPPTPAPAVTPTPPAPEAPPTSASPTPEAPAVTPAPTAPSAPPAPEVTAASQAPSAPPLPPAPSATVEPINWTMLWSVIGGVMVITLIILALARRRAY